MKKIIIVISSVLLCAFGASAYYFQKQAKEVGWLLDKDGVLTVSKDFELDSPCDFPWHSEELSVKKIVVTDGVTKISSGEFSGCDNVTSVNISASVKNIEVASFNLFDNKINSIIVDAKNPVYDSRDNCNAIIETEANKLIFGCNKTVIPNSVREIDNDAFENCKGLESITVPKGFTTLPLFRNCGLKSITIPLSVTSVGDCTFEGCKNLTAIVIPESVTEIGESAFEGCVNLAIVNIPKGVTKIADGLFNGCRSLKNIVITEGVKEKGNASFCECLNLASVNIPKSVDAIGDKAFSGGSKLSEISIPEGVREIGELAFSDCNLKKITLPKSLEVIGEDAFCRCPEKMEVHAEHATKPAKFTANPFTYTDKESGDRKEIRLTVYIPKGTIKEYKAAWGNNHKYVENVR